MRKKIYLFWILIIIVAIILVYVILIEEKFENTEVITFLIVLDGFSSDYLNKTTHLKELAEHWSSNISANSVIPSITPTAHASMFTGVKAEIHGIKNYNETHIKKQTIISKLKYKDIQSCVLVGKKSLSFLSNEADFSFDTTSLITSKENEIDIKTLEMTLSLYKEQKCKLFIINLPATDIIGHKYGPISKEMNFHLKELDNYLKEFLFNIKASTIIITADHGMCADKFGKGYHGTKESCSMKVPIIVISEILINESLSSIKDIYNLILNTYMDI